MVKTNNIIFKLIILILLFLNVASAFAAVNFHLNIPNEDNIHVGDQFDIQVLIDIPAAEGIRMAEFTLSKNNINAEFANAGTSGNLFLPPVTNSNNRLSSAGLRWRFGESTTANPPVAGVTNQLFATMRATAVSAGEITFTFIEADLNARLNALSGRRATTSSLPHTITILPATSTFSCTGDIPQGDATLCTGDDDNLEQNTARMLVSTCGTAKCEYTCNSGFTVSGNSCVQERGINFYFDIDSNRDQIIDSSPISIGNTFEIRVMTNVVGSSIDIDTLVADILKSPGTAVSFDSAVVNPNHPAVESSSTVDGSWHYNTISGTLTGRRALLTITATALESGTVDLSFDPATLSVTSVIPVSVTQTGKTISIVDSGACLNECIADYTQCISGSPTQFQICSNFDSDTCLEWGGSLPCGPGDVCVPVEDGTGRGFCQTRTTCTPSTVQNGVVAPAPACTITCNPGYELEEQSCVQMGGTLGDSCGTDTDTDTDCREGECVERECRDVDGLLESIGRIIRNANGNHPLLIQKVTGIARILRDFFS